MVSVDVSVNGSAVTSGHCECGCGEMSVLSLVLPAVILSGKEASGKTSALGVVVATRNSLQSCSKMTRIQKLFPKAHSALEELFGQKSEAGGWSDGIFTSLLRKATKVTGLVHRLVLHHWVF